ncbi:MAG: 4-hydroxy-tetrahydrodipicolinate reductase [Candidatus Bathyarchaeota archaeon]|nr:MAG: 4-hydroxy-tetrahydrodipicolinate reductase [Candidatus Bathyarchaeota archaeon]
MAKTIRVLLGGSEGRMGQVMQALIATTEDIELVSTFDLQNSARQTFSDIRSGTEISQLVDIYVDFTHPEAVLDNVKQAAEAELDSIIGTSGWYDHLDDVEAMAKDYGQRILYSPNFSPGVNVLFYAAQQVAQLLARFGYDAAIREIHHTDKIDAPSGTAITLGNLVRKATGKMSLAYTRRGKRNLSEIDVLGGRLGKVAGHHEVWFTPQESYAERLILQHDVFTRDVFGIGVLQGIRWLANAQKQRVPPGLYSFYNDVLGLSTAN